MSKESPTLRSDRLSKVLKDAHAERLSKAGMGSNVGRVAELYEALKKSGVGRLTEAYEKSGAGRLAKAVKESGVGRLVEAYESSESGRLVRAAAGVGGYKLHSNRHGIPKSKNAPESANYSRSVIKYANPTSALRKHVARAEVLSKPSASSVIHVPARAVDAPPPPGTIPQSLSKATPAPALPSAVTSVTVRAKVGAIVLRTTADLGEIVRRARMEHRLSQEELAKAAGTGRRFISELEAGKPTLEFGRLLSVCNALGVRLLASGSPDEL